MQHLNPHPGRNMFHPLFYKQNECSIFIPLVAKFQKGSKLGLDFTFCYVRNYLQKVLMIQGNVIIGDCISEKGQCLGDQLHASLQELGTLSFHRDFAYV